MGFLEWLSEPAFILEWESRPKNQIHVHLHGTQEEMEHAREMLLNKRKQLEQRKTIDL